MEYISDFKTKQDFEKRVNESLKLNCKYPDRIPVIVDRAEKKGPDINCHKFLVPKDLTMAGFAHVLRARINMKPSDALFIFIGNSNHVPSSARMVELYKKHGDIDGFLYMSYALENTFG